ncbi:hypothetical protein AJ78_01314 [Emergomyces pasteurianus Ep9510]|uniref:AP complex mu/sigma subunit domain-containing protein n=1 Tax=Emergomyces pasteurianus Ep9510 TaxID=1447872 RepID=A0A1J9QES6_9EURO|nr:hypothetical protein AJ78_01314 [Emergomyces pasteurianus Ep9510]
MSCIDTKVVYRRYASLFFIAGCSSDDNELITLEIVHRYVEQMDKYYGNVCELDIIFNFQKAYFILDELLLAGELQESSKKNVLRCISQQDSLEDMEVSLDGTFSTRNEGRMHGRGGWGVISPFPGNALLIFLHHCVSSFIFSFTFLSPYTVKLVSWFVEFAALSRANKFPLPSSATQVEQDIVTKIM